MLRYYDPTGFARDAKAWTEDGFRYPFTAMDPTRPHVFKWTDEVPPPTQVLEVHIVAIHCGPDAPYPLPPNPQQILDGALGLGNH